MKRSFFDTSIFINFKNFLRTFIFEVVPVNDTVALKAAEIRSNYNSFKQMEAMNIFDKKLAKQLIDHIRDRVSKLLNNISSENWALITDSITRLVECSDELFEKGVRWISYDDIMLGVSVLRNEHLANVFYRLRLIETYGIGILKIRESYSTV